MHNSIARITTMHKLRHLTRLLATLAVALLLQAAWASAADVRTLTDEGQLIDVLRTAEKADKAMACKRLTIYGSKAAVPELAKLLADEQLSSWARTALEAIPGPEADEALRKSMDSLYGKLLVGTINSIAVRRDAAAVEPLVRRLKDDDAEVASAAAVALGRIGNDAAAAALRQSLAGASDKVRSAIAEGCILAAERLMAENKHGDAAAIYDQVRTADVPKQRVLEATRGAILARQAEGVPLLLENLKSTDRGLFQIAVMTARELSGRGVADAIAGQIAGATPERASMILFAIGDRRDEALPAAVLAATKQGPKPVRAAAIAVVGRSGDAASLPVLLAIATEDDAELSQAAKAALAGLSGDKVNAEIVKRLAEAEGKPLAALIELVGMRRIDATKPLIAAVDHRDAEIRRAALTALGATVGPQELPVLMKKAIVVQDTTESEVAHRALRAAAVRMPDRESTAALLAGIMSEVSPTAKAQLLETLGAMGGPKALATLAAAAKSGNAELQDISTRLLGEWMNADAGPTLLDVAKNVDSEKYQVRALRGYIRLARQFDMSNEERAKRCEQALAAAKRIDEQKLVLQVLERYPSADTLKVAVKAQEIPELKEEAANIASSISRRLNDKGGKRAKGSSR
jgi:HEAT repeat protein